VAVYILFPTTKLFSLFLSSQEKTDCCQQAVARICQLVFLRVLELELFTADTYITSFQLCVGNWAFSI
jgi:hypothetical protein